MKISIYSVFQLFLFISISASLTAQSKVEIKKNSAGQTRIGVTDNNFNLYVGESSGINSSSTALQNVGIGDNTLRDNIVGNGNTALGSTALNFTTGSLNTAMGANALRKNTTGGNNVAIGNAAFEEMINGSNNVAVGSRAGFNAKGDLNVFMGFEAGRYSTSGNRLYIENSSADSSQALIYGEFDNDKLRFNAQTSIYSNSTSENGIYVEKTHTGFFDIPAIKGVNKQNDFYGVGVQGEGGYIGVVGLTGGTGPSSYSGVYGGSTGVNLGTNIGVRGFASGGTLNYGIYGIGNGTQNAFAGYFQGQLRIKQVANEQTYFHIENAAGQNVLIINDDDVVEVNRFKANWKVEMDSLVTNWYTNLTNVTTSGNTSLTNVTTNGNTNLEIENGKRINKATTMNYYIAVEGTFPSTAGSIQNNTIVGEIRLFPAMNVQPTGWLPCEGQVLNILDHQALYSLIGTNYGGDGTTTFVLPDMRKAVPHHN